MGTNLGGALDQWDGGGEVNGYHGEVSGGCSGSVDWRGGHL